MSFGIGLIGTGYMAQRQSQALAAHPDARLEIVWSTARSGRAAQDFCARYGFVRATSHLDDLFADPRVDIVFVCTPDATHPEYVVRALEAAKHVFTEKPLARTRADFQAIGGRLEASGRTLQVGMNARFWPKFVRAREIVEEGRLGELRFVRGVYVQNAVEAVSSQVKPWVVEPPADANQFLHGGGLHCLDVMRWVAGDVVSVFARGAGFELADVWDLDTFSVSIEFEGGALGEMLVSASAFRPDEFSLELWLARGSVVDETAYLRQDGATGPDARRLETSASRRDLADQFDNLVDAIATGRSPLNSFVEAEANFALLKAIERSIEIGLPVTMPTPLTRG